jgi:hypothetical protein
MLEPPEERDGETEGAERDGALGPAEPREGDEWPPIEPPEERAPPPPPIEPAEERAPPPPAEPPPRPPPPR